MTSTWGISDQLFLAVYAVLLGRAGFAVGRAFWAAARPSTHQLNDPADLDPYQAAMLNSRDAHVVTIALTRLKQAGSVQIDSRAKTIVTSDQPPLSPHPAERAVYDLLGYGGPRPLRAVRSQARRAAVFDQLRERLIRLGLLRDPAQVRRALLHVLWLLPVLVLGIGRLGAQVWDGAPNDLPPDSFIFLLMLVFVAAVVLVIAGGTLVGALLRKPRPTSRGQRTLGRLYRRYQHLGPDGIARPRSTDDVPWAMALFGMGALWDADADLAAALELPREAVMRHAKRYAGSGGGGGGGGGGGCGGGGCGGGGCGG